MTSYAALMQGHNIVDECQRISCNRTPNSAAILGGRLVICKDLTFGCKAEKGDPYQPYVFGPTWCVFVRAQDEVDLGRYVRRVTFRMSPRLPLRLHVADSSPFEITEVLSTDFPIEMQVQYVDNKMTPTTYVYNPRACLEAAVSMPKLDHHMCHLIPGDELADKMIFVNPSPQMRICLTTPGPKLPEPRPLRLFRPKERAQDKAKKSKKDAKKQQQPPKLMGRLNVHGKCLLVNQVGRT